MNSGLSGRRFQPPAPGPGRGLVTHCLLKSRFPGPNKIILNHWQQAVSCAFLSPGYSQVTLTNFRSPCLIGLVRVLGRLSGNRPRRHAELTSESFTEARPLGPRSSSKEKVSLDY